MSILVSVVVGISAAAGVIAYFNDVERMRAALVPKVPTLASRRPGGLAVLLVGCPEFLSNF
jgi:hypothetical protein